MDSLSPEHRSAVMRAVRRTDTSPEMAVRRLVHAMGGRYLLHDKRLPGTPDLVFPRRRIVVFVHGCFWHRHQDCRLATMPKSNIKFWSEKFRKNVERDKMRRIELEAQGWRVIVVWQCEISHIESLRTRLASELSLS
jgi:DNA mismatch endonuclease (patch repair protein)